MGLIVALVVLGSGAVLAAGMVGYLLWPHWPDATAARDAPTMPITVGGVFFNVPPAAIRHSAQRRPGAQERLDLAFQWPGLHPPEAKAKPVLAPDLRPAEQLFVSIARPQGTMALQDRIKTIYPRYLAPTAFQGPKGLSGVSFRDGTPYQGEDLFYDPHGVERFLVRCTRDTALTHGTCLLERRAGAAELVVRFPRDLLEEWSQLTDGLEMLLSSLQASS
jgi:hypothetical protein